MDEFYCQFCNKLCKNLNSLRQHEVRCPKNPNRRNFDELAKAAASRKGLTKHNCSTIAKQVATMQSKYANGYVHPGKGQKRFVVHIHDEHNMQEVIKWNQFTSSLDVKLPVYETAPFGRDGAGYHYSIVRRGQSRNGNTVNVLFEHIFVVEQYLGHELDPANVIHHIDGDGRNNDICNLMIFASKGDHMRYHNCSDAWLIYDDVSHVFTCEKRGCTA